MNKHEAMITYFSPHCEEIAGRVLQFNSGQNEAHNISFITEYGDKVEKRYLSGAQKAYGFAIVITAPFSFDTDDLNLNAMTMAQNFLEWIESQNAQRLFPDFGKDCDVQKIEALQNMPALADVDPENLVARYMLHCKVTYYEKREVKRA